MMKPLLCAPKLFLASLLFRACLSKRTLTIPQNDTCTAPECIRAAAHLLNNLHPDYDSIDPCEDFDTYVCGGFPSQWPREETIDTVDSVSAMNRYKLQSILEGEYPRSDLTQNDSDGRIAFDMVVQNYQSCMNESAIEAASDDKLMHEIVSNITNLLPVSEADLTSNATLVEEDLSAMADAIAYLQSIGAPVFGEFWTIADTQNPDVLVPQFGLNFYNNSDHALPARINILELALVPEAKLTGIIASLYNGNNNFAVEKARQIFHLANAIGGVLVASLADIDGLDALYYSTTVAEAVELAPYLALDKVIQRLAPADYKLDRMVFQYHESFSNISTIIADTPKSTLQALMVVLAYLSYEPYFSVTKALRGDRWRDVCFQYADQSLPWIASKFFVDATYSNETLDIMEAIANDITTAYTQRVSRLDWMHNDTKALVREKIVNTIPQIGYPKHTPATLNSTDLLAYHANISITPSLLYNALSIRHWASTRAWSALSHPASRTIWLEAGVHAYWTNARYSFKDNAFFAPSSLSSAPIFFPDAPSYLHYGAMGLVVGHEMTHGLDANGRRWDAQGRYREWWDEASIEEFENKTRCFVEQFDELEAVDHNGVKFLNTSSDQPLKLNGAFTLSENIADAGGLANAWEAWNLAEQRRPSQMLPGLEKWSKEQLFFLAAGQMWCSKYSRESMKAYIERDAHAPPFARIKGIALNSRAFRETWGCAVKEPVCELW